MEMLLIIVAAVVVILIVKASIGSDDNTGPFDCYVPGGR